MKKEDRVKPAIVTDTRDGKEYTLDFNADTIRYAERRGFTVEDLQNFPATKAPEFFIYAFRMHHPTATEKFINGFREHNHGIPQALIVRLMELYQQAIKDCNILIPDSEEVENPGMLVMLD